MTKKRYFFTVLILGSLTALGPFSIDMYLPGFPAIAAALLWFFPCQVLFFKL